MKKTIIAAIITAVCFASPALAGDFINDRIKAGNKQALSQMEQEAKKAHAMLMAEYERMYERNKEIYDLAQGMNSRQFNEMGKHDGVVKDLIYLIKCNYKVLKWFKTWQDWENAKKN